MKRMNLMLAGLVAALALTVGCNNPGQICETQYDCKDELEVDYEDDYKDVCGAQLAGSQAALRENEEKECEDLANAQGAYLGCVAGLECDEVKKHCPGGNCFAELEADTFCKGFGTSLKEALEATDGGAKCDAIGD